MRGPRKSKPVGVLTKTLQIIDLLQVSRSPLSLHEINLQAGINKKFRLPPAHAFGGRRVPPAG